MYKPYYFQEEAIFSIFDYFSSGKQGNPVICCPTGCHAKGTEILMYDGSIKKVEDIIIGDLLMGPDSKSRRVLNLARGRQEMRKIIPTKGKSFVVNLDHKIFSKVMCQSNSRTSESFKERNEVITIREYENGTKWYKHIRKLQRTNVNFKERNTKLEFWPWFLGICLGDGSLSHSFGITTADKEIVERITAYAYKAECQIRIADKGDNKAKTYFITDKVSNCVNPNRFVGALTRLGLWGTNSSNKFIPDDYKLGSKDTRLGILAGLLDSDGHLDNCGVFDYISKSKQLAEDVVFIARSLGLAAYLKECEKTCTNNGVKGNYFRVCISGDLSKIPCVIPKKQASIRLQKKSVLVTGFKVEVLPEDDFYGFTLTDDRLYLTSDFIIHHNTGKSLIIAEFIKRVLHSWPTQRVMMLTHVSELIKQNSEKLLTQWPTAPLGIYSAGLNSRESIMPIVFGGIQSVAKTIKKSLSNGNNKPAHLKHFGWRDLVLVDEAHLLSPKEDTMYQYVLGELLKINPYLKVIGFTATPYRLKQGMITDDGLFTDVCYDITGIDAFNRLIAEGYISPLIPKRTDITIDVSNIGITGGDFNKKQLEAAVDKDEVTYAAVKEMVEQGFDRRSWLIFASSVSNSEHIAAMLQSFGIHAAATHSKLSDEDNNKRISDFKNGSLRALVNNNKLTTGFDCPQIDMIGMLRPTCSPGLWVQMLGRGTRPCENKSNCLVLDFAGNTKRLGPINDPVKPRKKGKGTPGDAPIRICDSCGVYNHASARFCINCGKEFLFETKLFKHAGTDQLLRSDAPIVEYFDVQKVIYNLHEKKNAEGTLLSPPMIKVSYFCGFQMYNKYVCLEHPGVTGKQARDWWRQHHHEEPPPTTHEALQRVNELRIPKRIRVWVNRKWPEILNMEY